MKADSKALLIVNPTSGRRQAQKRLFDIVHVLCGFGCATTVVCTDAPGSARREAARLAADFDLIVCCGGDGTLNEVVSGVLVSGADRPIGYIPAGTTNDFARSLDLPVRNLCDATAFAATGTPHYHDIGKLGDNKNFLYIASFGAFTSTSYLTPQWLKNIFGHMAYTINGITGMGKIRPYKLRLKTSLTELEGDFVFGGVANTTSIGGMISLDKASVALDDGMFEILLVRRPKSPASLHRILYELNTHRYDSRDVVFLHTDSATFEFEDDVDWTVDGEFGGTYRTAEISLIHDKVQIIH